MFALVCVISSVLLVLATNCFPFASTHAATAEMSAEDEQSRITPYQPVSTRRRMAQDRSTVYVGDPYLSSTIFYSV